VHRRCGRPDNAEEKTKKRLARNGGKWQYDRGFAGIGRSGEQRLRLT
jgi:hypothetical protein